MICPPKTSPEWKDLVSAVGEYEATRDWIDNDYTIRSVEAVSAKLATEIHHGYIPHFEIPENIPESIDDIFRKNYDFEGKKTIHKIEKISDLAKFKKKRKDNYKLFIDKKKYPPHNPNLIKVGDKMVFVKVGNNPAMEEFYPFLDYKNPIKLKSRTYYFLTNKFTYDTSENIKAKEIFDIRYALAAKEGRYGIRPSIRANMSPRLKEDLKKYLEETAKQQEGQPEFIAEKTRELKENIRGFITNRTDYSDPELRKSAIDTLMSSITINRPEQADQFRSILGKLPTVVLANMTLNYIDPVAGFHGTKLAIEEGKVPVFDDDNGNEMGFVRQGDFWYTYRNEEIGENPLTELEMKMSLESYSQIKEEDTVPYFLSNMNKALLLETPLPPRPFAPNIGSNARIPQGPRWQPYIDKVNEQIFNNTYNKELTQHDKYVLETLFRKPPEHKSKGIAVLIEVFNSKGYDEAEVFKKAYAAHTLAQQARLRIKLRENNPLFKELEETYDAIAQLYGVYNKMAIYDIYNKEFTVNTFPYKLPSVKAIGHFVYDMAAYSPKLRTTNQLIDKMFQEGAFTNYLTYKDHRSNFAAIYEAVITQEGPLAQRLMSTTLWQQIKDAIWNLVNHLLGRNTETPMDILEQKIRDIHEVISASDSFVSMDNYRIGGREAAPYMIGDPTDYVLWPRNIRNMIHNEVPVELINREIKNSYINDLDLSTIEVLPEGLDLSRFSIIRLNDLTKFPRDIKFPESGATIYLKQFKRSNIPQRILSKIQNNDLRTKDPVIQKNSTSQIITKTKSQVSTAVKPKYGFEHAARYYPQGSPAFHYTLKQPGQRVTVEFSDPTGKFPEELHDALNYHGVGVRFSEKGALGWFGGVIVEEKSEQEFFEGSEYHGEDHKRRKVFYVTEVQSDFLQRIHELKAGKGLRGADLSKFSHLKSQVENYYDGWFYVFAGTGIRMILENNPGIEEIRIPTTAYYKTHHPGAPTYIYDKIGSMFKHTLEEEFESSSKLDKEAAEINVRLQKTIIKLQESQINFREKSNNTHYLVGNKNNVTGFRSKEAAQSELDRIKDRTDDPYEPTIMLTKEELLSRMRNELEELNAELKEREKKLDELENKKVYKWQVIKVSDIASNVPVNMKDQYDIIIKSAVSAGVKDQKELTSDLASDRELAHDVITALMEHDIFKKYFNSDVGKEHLKEIQDYIDKTYSNEKPLTDDTIGGELVDPEGNVIPEEEEPSEFDDLVKRTAKGDIKLDIEQLVNELIEAARNKNKQRVAYLEQLLKEYDKQNNRRGNVSFMRPGMSLAEIARHYEVNEFGFFRSNIDPAKLKQDLNRAGFTEYTVVQTSTGGYYIKGPTGKVNFYRDNISDPHQQDVSRANEIAWKVIENLVKGSGMKVLSVTEEEAAEATKGTNNPWKNEPVFTMGDVIYVVTDRLTTTMAFHEFAHPVLRSMWMNESTVKTFRKMYDDLSQTAEGKNAIAHVEREYGDYLKPDTDMFREEVLATALGERASAIYNKTEQSKGFLAAINKILYHIKQFFRKLFTGPIRPENLDVTTTFEQLAQMLVNKDFVINTEIVSQEDVAVFMKENNKMQSEIFGANLQDKMKPLIDLLYQVTWEDAVKVMSNKEVPEMYKLISSEYGDDQLKDLRRTLNQARKPKDLVEQKEILEEQSKAFIKALYQLEEITARMKTEMDSIAHSPRTKDDVLRTQYINNFLKFFHQVLAGTGGAKDMLRGLPPRSAIGSLLQDVINNIEETKSHADSIIKEGMSLLITDILEYQSKQVEKIMNQIKELRAAGVKESVIKSYQDLYDKLKVTPATIKAMMSGMGDANKINSFMEGWLYNSDPIVGGLGILMKNTLNSVNKAWMDTFTDFLRSVVPLAKEAGINLKSTRVDELTSKVTFTDYKAVWNPEKGELERTPVLSFISPHKEYKWVTKDIDYRVANAEKKYEETNLDEDKEALAKLLIEQDEIYSHMWREYTDEYYDKNSMFDSVIGKKALIEMKRLYKEKNDIVEKAHSEVDYLSLKDEINQVDKKIRDLYSLYDQNGNLKPEGSEAREIAEVLLLARDYNRAVYRWELRPGEIQRKFKQFQQELVDKLNLDPESDEFKSKTQAWIKQNTVRALTPEFYEDKKLVSKQFKDLFKRISDRLSTRVTTGRSSGWEESALKLSQEIADNYEKLWNVLSSNPDYDSQPQGTSFSPEATALIKQYEREIERLKKLKDNLLTDEEQNTLAELLQRWFENPHTITDEEMDMIDELQFKKSAGMTDGEKTELSKIVLRMETLQGKVPTDYYLDTINEFLTHFDMEKNKDVTERIKTVIGNRKPDDISEEELKKLNKKQREEREKNEDLFERISKFTGLTSLELSADNADDIINILAKSYLDPNDKPKGTILDALLESIPGFKDWFNANHYSKAVWNKKLGKKSNNLARTSQWTEIKPTSPSHIEYVHLTDINDNVIKVEGKPVFRFMKREVNDGFKTGYDPTTKKVEPELGVQKDVFGNWLPRSQEQGAPSDRFMNEEYEKIRVTNPKLFKLIREITTRYLQQQVDSDRPDKLGYEFPRIRAQKGLLPNLETIQKGALGKIAKSYWENLKDFFRKTQDDPNLGFNPDRESIRQQVLFNEDLYTNTQSMIVNGTAEIEMDDVSRDMFYGVAQYFGGLEQKRQLKKILPFFEATHSVLTDPINKIRNMKNVQRANWESQYLAQPLVRNGKNIRASAIKDFMDRFFYGYTNEGLFADNKGIQAIVNAMFKGASFSYLAWQIPSAIANATVQMTQNFIRAASGQQYTIGELAKGSTWAASASVHIANEIYRTEPNSVTVQLIQLFDAVPGMTEQKLGTSPGRTPLRDLVSLSWLYSPRKFMENYATLQAFGAIMLHEKVKRTVNGIETIIPYAEAWELHEGKIRLKSGIDSTYAPDGKEFNRILNMIQHVQHDMNGAYDHFSQPEAYRYIIYRMIAFLRKYVTTMITNRFAITRRSPGMMDVRTGFYTSTVLTLYKILQDPKMYRHMSADETAAMKQFFTEMSLVFLMYAMYGLFGWDPDDPDKYEKLRAKSGPLPLPFVAETENPFKVDGWLSNHMLLQLLKLKSQTEMWIPWPGLGLKDYTSLASAAPAALGPTVDQYAKILDTIIKLGYGDTRAYYQREIGPYEWQQEMSPKLYNYIMQIPGFRGTTPDPILGIRKQEQSKVLQ